MVFLYEVLTFLRCLHSFPTRRSSDLTTPVIAGDSFEMDAVDALRLSPLRRGLAIDSTRSEERFSRNAETDLVCRLLLEKKKNIIVILNSIITLLEDMIIYISCLQTHN